MPGAIRRLHHSNLWWRRRCGPGPAWSIQHSATDRGVISTCWVPQPFRGVRERAGTTIPPIDCKIRNPSQIPASLQISAGPHKSAVWFLRLDYSAPARSGCVISARCPTQARC